jgi:hypothetical protein
MPVVSHNFASGNGTILAYAVLIGVLALALLVLVIVKSARPGDPGDADTGSGGGGVPGPEPEPAPGGGQAWWPEFERQFATYVARRDEPDRQPVGLRGRLEEGAHCCATGSSARGSAPSSRPRAH